MSNTLEDYKEKKKLYNKKYREKVKKSPKIINKETLEEQQDDNLINEEQQEEQKEEVLINKDTLDELIKIYNAHNETKQELKEDKQETKEKKDSFFLSNQIKSQVTTTLISTIMGMIPILALKAFAGNQSSTNSSNYSTQQRQQDISTEQNNQSEQQNRRLPSYF